MQDQRAAFACLCFRSGQRDGQVGAQEQVADIEMAGIPAQAAQRVEAQPRALAEPARRRQLPADDDRPWAQPADRRRTRRDKVDRRIKRTPPQIARQGAPDGMQA